MLLLFTLTGTNGDRMCLILRICDACLPSSHQKWHLKYNIKVKWVISWSEGPTGDRVRCGRAQGWKWDLLWVVDEEQVGWWGRVANAEQLDGWDDQHTAPFGGSLSLNAFMTAWRWIRWRRGSLSPNSNVKKWSGLCPKTNPAFQGPQSIRAFCPTREITVNSPTLRPGGRSLQSTPRSRGRSRLQESLRHSGWPRSPCDLRRL